MGVYAQKWVVPPRDRAQKQQKSGEPREHKKIVGHCSEGSMSDTTQPKTTRGRILEIRCTCGRRLMDARLDGKSLVRVRCPRCGNMVQVTADTYKAEPKKQDAE